MRTSNSILAHLFVFVSLCAVGAVAQQPPQGPLTPPPKREVKRIPATPRAEAPPMPAEEMIERFSRNEEALRRAHGTYSYRRSVRVQEWDAEGNAGGEFQVAMEVTARPDGRRAEKIAGQPVETLKLTTLALEDLEELVRVPLFVFTPDQLPDYEISYIGRQPLDELSTFVFRIAPKQLDRQRRFFEGLIWVDDRDFVIVKTYGRMASEVEETGPELPFALFETYREFVDGRYWFPTFTRSEDIVKLSDGEGKLRLTVRLTDYKTSAPPSGENPQPPRP